MIIISDKQLFFKVHEESCKCNNWVDNTFFKNKSYEICEEMVCVLCKCRYIFELSEMHEFFQGDLRKEFWNNYFKSINSNSKKQIKSKLPEFNVTKSNDKFWVHVDGYAVTKEQSEIELIEKVKKWIKHHSN